MDRPDQPDPDLAAELRETASNEVAQEAAEEERLTELMRRRRLDLGQVFKDVASRGDRVTVEFGGHGFSGATAFAGEDYATLHGSGQSADVRYETATWSVIPAGAVVGADHGARFASGGAESFKALLKEYSAAGTRLRLALPESSILVGAIGVVANDHVEFNDADGRLLYVPLEMILAIIRATDFQ